MYKIILFTILIFTICHSNTMFYIQKYSRAWKVDPRIVHAIIQVESEGITNARSNKGAIGLMQIMPVTAREYYRNIWKKKKHKFALWFMKQPDISMAYYLKNTRRNINIGCWYLNKCLKKYKGNYIRAISYYNMGVNNTKYNLDYVHKVISKVINYHE